MKLAYRKSTGELIPDFQERATERVLLANAVRRGIPGDDVDVREVSVAEYRRLEARQFGPLRVAEEAQQQQLTESARALQEKMGWTDAEVLALRRLVTGPELPPE